MLRTEIYAKLEIEGLHQWTDCPIVEVDYLKHLHRHNFGIIAYADVSHDDRDIEFIEFKHKIHEYLNSKYYNEQYKCCVFGQMSCEMIAKELILKFELSRCEVSEDGENGAIVVATYD